MSSRLSLIGQKFGTWTVMGLHHCNRHAYWICVCDCGHIQIIQGSYLKYLYANGKIFNCKCLADNQKSTKYTNKINIADSISKPTKNHKLRADNKCGKQGIYFNKKIKKWSVSIYTCGKRINLGAYTDIDIAKKIRAEAETKYRKVL